METEITIGRDAADSRLFLKADGNDTHYGHPGSVPQCVAEEHCKLNFSGSTIRIKNLDVNNYTYVNGRSVESKAISKGDKIELGIDRYLLSWEAIEQVAPVNIMRLRTIWNNYEDQNMELQIAERKFNTLRSTTGLLTMAAIALSIATGGRSVWYIVLYALAIIFSLVFFIKAYRDSSSIPQKRQELNRQFQRDYVCPHCGHFMGNQSFEILTQSDHCPYCKKQFIH